MADITLNPGQWDFVNRFITPIAPPPPPVAAAAPNAGAADDPEAARLRASASEARRLWVDAKDGIDARIGALQTRLRAYDDADCQRLADKVLTGYTDRFQVRLIASLMDAERCPAGKADTLRGAALGSIDAYATEVAGAVRLSALDHVASLAEIGVPLNIQSEMGRALAAMKSQLAP